MLVMENERRRISEKLIRIDRELEVVGSLPLAIDRMLLSLVAKMYMHYYEDVFKHINESPPLVLQSIKDKVMVSLGEYRKLSDADKRKIPSGDAYFLTLKLLDAEIDKVMDCVVEDKLSTDDLMDIHEFLHERLAMFECGK